MSGPELHVVIEIGARPGHLWFDPPADPWPRFVRLWGATPEDHVALVLVVASSYGRADGEPATSIAQLLADFPHVLPGGVGVVLDERAIMPSCCCGLEHWSEWRRFLTTGQSPWTGHDPAPLVEARDDVVQIWSDGGMGEKPSRETPITFSRSTFQLAVDAAAQDLRDFLNPLRAWFNVYAPQASATFVSKFAATFIRA